MTAKFITDAIETTVRFKGDIPDDVLEKLLAEIEYEVFEREIKRNPEMFRNDWPESKL